MRRYHSQYSLKIYKGYFIIKTSFIPCHLHWIKLKQVSFLFFKISHGGNPQIGPTLFIQICQTFQNYLYITRNEKVWGYQVATLEIYNQSKISFLKKYKKRRRKRGKSIYNKSVCDDQWEEKLFTADKQCKLYR